MSLMRLALVICMLIVMSMAQSSKKNIQLTMKGSKGFGSERTISSSLPNNPSKSNGFGSKSNSAVSRNQVVDSSNQISMEHIIQKEIDSTPGLRAAMLQYTSNHQMSDKNTENGGWSKTNVHNRLHEITWDASAHFRDTRHNEHTPSMAMETFLLTLAAKIVKSTQMSRNAQIYDVGCGTGVLIKYLLEFCRQNNIPFTESSVFGIDLSSEMIKIARKRYTTSTFIKGDFLAYDPSITFSTVVFNECLHNFADIRSVLTRAQNVVEKGGNIIVSNPKGYKNILMQNRANSWLSPSLLPTEEEWRLLLSTHDVGLQLVEPPDVNSPHYLAVLSKV